jgi:DedD protein
VVLVPMFLEREPRLQKQDMDIRIPPIPGHVQQGPTPSAAPTPPAAAPAATPPQAGGAAPGEQVPSSGVASTSKPVTTEAPTPNPTGAEPESTAPQAALAAKPAEANPLKSPVDGGFVIQLGAYSNASNARQLLKQLKANKFPAYVEPVKTTKGDKTRVRVGPYSSAEAAEKARERLRALKLMPVSDAKVVRMGE